MPARECVLGKLNIVFLNGHARRQVYQVATEPNGPAGSPICFTAYTLIIYKLHEASRKKKKQASPYTSMARLKPLKRLRV